MIQSTRRRRPGFTLIELLTVVGIILVLASMLVAVAYTGNNKQIVGSGATNLVGWLKTAQAYALRDQKPYGVRFQVDPTGMVTAAQYLEQPSDWNGPVGSTISVTPAATTAAFTITGTGVDFSGGFGGSFAPTWPIQPGDYLECNGGQIAQITGVSTNQLSCQMMAGDIVGMWGFTNISDFRIVRRPRAMIGADMLALNGGVGINTNTNTTYGSPLPMPVPGNVDIVFGPTGAVITPGLAGRDIRLWLVDTTQPGFSSTANTFAGEQFIVTVGVRTGLISIQPVDVTGAGSGTYTQPYSFTQDGRSSGF